MEEREARELLRCVASGAISPDDALIKLKTAPFDDLGYAKVDLQRGLRQGVAEVVYGAGKTASQIAGIVASMRAAGQERVLVTRLDADKAADVRHSLGVDDAAAFVYHEVSRVGLVGGGCLRLMEMGVSSSRRRVRAIFPLPKRLRWWRRRWATRCNGSTMWAWRGFIDCLRMPKTSLLLKWLSRLPVWKERLPPSLAVWHPAR